MLFHRFPTLYHYRLMNMHFIDNQASPLGARHNIFNDLYFWIITDKPCRIKIFPSIVEKN